MIRLGNDPLNAVHLNMPSINAPVMPGRLTTTRVATNVSGRRLRYDIAADGARRQHASRCRRRRFNLDPAQSAELDITIESDAPSASSTSARSGSSRANRGYPTLHLPVAFVPAAGRRER